MIPLTRRKSGLWVPEAGIVTPDDPGWVTPRNPLGGPQIGWPVPLQAAFPTPNLTDHKFASWDATSGSLDYPDNISADDLLLILASSDSTDTALSATGYNLLWENSRDDGSIGMLWRRATGSESGSITVTTNTVSEQNVLIHMRISGAHTTTDPEVTAHTLKSATPDPAALNPTNWGTEDTLWIVCLGLDTVRAVNTQPSGYTWDSTSNGDYTRTTGSGTLGATMSWAYLQSAVASEDPGTWAIASNTDCSMGTVGIRPAPAAGFSGEEEYHDMLRAREQSPNVTVWS